MKQILIMVFILMGFSSTVDARIDRYDEKGLKVYKKYCKECHGNSYKGATMKRESQWQKLFQDDAKRFIALHENIPEAKEIEATDFDESYEIEKEFGEAPLEFLSFMLGREEYALPLARISEIIKPRTVTEVPRCPDFVLGIISLRGIIIPVFDLAAKLRFGNVGWERSARIVVVRRSDGELVGLFVDSVRDVVRVLPDDIEPPPPALAGVEAQFLDGVGWAEDSRRARIEYAADIDDAKRMELQQTAQRKLVILLNLDKVAVL